MSTYNINITSRTYEKGVTAHAGGGQSLATAITKNLTRVDTVATTEDSCKLDAATVGKYRSIQNTSSVDMALFPDTGESYFGMANNNALIVAGGSKVELFCYEVGVWTII